MIVDAHQHLWRIGRNGHEWPTAELGDIYRDFTAEDLGAVTAGLVDATVLVQSQPSDADTDWMLEQAAASSLIKGVVGWVDMAAPDAPARIARLAQDRKLKGLRPMLQALDDDDWILRPELAPAIAAMIDHGLTFDALVFPRHLLAIEELASMYPDLSIVIDHGGKPLIAHPSHRRTWEIRIRRLAGFDNVHAKLSGLVTEMIPGQKPAEMTAYADFLFDQFGWNRLMWGSDWPVVLLRADYQTWFDWTQTWLDGQPPEARDAVMGRTAQTFYKLDI